MSLTDCFVVLTAPIDKVWNYENVARWATHNGAYFSNTVDAETTHLLATREQYNAKGPKIQEAIKLNVHIVTTDWMEDSLRKKRRMNEKSYLLTSYERKAEAKRKREAKIQKGIHQAEKFVNTNLCHIYRDETYFHYEITLTREDKEYGRQKYILFFWESNARPHLYQFTVKFFKKPTDKRPSIYRPREVATCFKTAFDDFTAFFHQKTGIAWNDRVAKVGTTPQTRFQYIPPTGGKPVGVFDPVPGTVSEPAPPTDTESDVEKLKQQLLSGPMTRKRKSELKALQSKAGGKKHNTPETTTEKPATRKRKSQESLRSSGSEKRRKTPQGTPEKTPSTPASRKRKSDEESISSSGSEKRQRTGKSKQELESESEQKAAKTSAKEEVKKDETEEIKKEKTQEEKEAEARWHAESKKRLHAEFPELIRQIRYYKKLREQEKKEKALQEAAAAAAAAAAEKEKADADAVEGQAEQQQQQVEKSNLSTLVGEMKKSREREVSGAKTGDDGESVDEQNEQEQDENGASAQHVAPEESEVSEEE
ncbi:hypothetical protein F5Y11DRAFT_352883 [Daldinia sp. FL1419]|nr:hypothetical protein F5Y11DRAFT_352883 [Daldinia sp. FL1419]